MFDPDSKLFCIWWDIMGDGKTKSKFCNNNILRFLEWVWFYKKNGSNRNKYNNTRQMVKDCTRYGFKDCKKRELNKITFYTLISVSNLFYQINNFNCGILVIVNTKYVINYIIIKNLYKNIDLLIILNTKNLIILNNFVIEKKSITKRLNKYNSVKKICLYVIG